MKLPSVSARPSSLSSTSTSLSASGLALTLIWILIEGAFWCWSARGAFGFSNDRSLMYWARTLSCGSFSGAALSAGPPFVIVMQ